MTEIMVIVPSAAHAISSNGVHHNHSKYLLKEIGSEYDDLVYLSVASKLSTGAAERTFFNLQTTQIFSCGKKGIKYHSYLMRNGSWFSDSMRIPCPSSRQK
jgi:hypothetical protein